MMKHFNDFELVLVLITFAAYVNSFFADLVFDDISAISLNEDLRPNETSFLDIWTHDFWGTPIHQESSHKSYRPLTVLTFRFNYLLHELEPFGYHFMNVVLHICATLLFHRVSSHLIFINSKKRINRNGEYLIGSVLFGLHPVHVEAVTGVVGRAELLAAVFFFLSFLAFTKNQIWLFTTYAICSLLSKEQGITVLGVCFVYELTSRSMSKNGKPVLTIHWLPLTMGSILRLLLITVIGVVSIAFRIWIMGGRHNFPVFTKFDNPASFCNFPTRHLTYNFLLPLNTVLLLFPLDLCCDWTMKSIPLIESFFDPKNIWTIIFYTVFSLLVHRALKEFRSCHENGRKARIPTMLAMLVFPFIPASNLIIPVGFVLAERILYLPSAGFCLLISLGFIFIRRKKRAIKFIYALLTITIFSFTLRTIIRTLDWENELKLFTSGIETTDWQNGKLINNLGHYYEKQKNYTQALVYFKKAKNIQPDDLGSTINIARTFINMGEATKAEQILWYIKPKVKQLARLNSKRIVPTYLNLWINLGNILAQNNSRLREAEDVYLELISMRSDFVDAYINLGDILIKQNRINEAIEVYMKSLEYGQKQGDIYYNIGVAHSLLLQVNAEGNNSIKDSVALSLEIQKISSFFIKSLEHNSANKEALLNLAILVQKYPSVLRNVKQNIIEKMLNYRGSDQERIWFNVALLYSDAGDNKTAEIYLRKAVMEKPDFRSALFNLALILIEEQRLFEAELFLNQLIHYHPDHSKSLLLLGDIYIEFNELDKAEECYLSALQQNYTNSEVVHNLCIIYARRDKIENTKDCLEKMKSISRKDGKHGLSNNTYTQPDSA